MFRHPRPVSSSSYQIRKVGWNHIKKIDDTGTEYAIFTDRLNAADSSPSQRSCTNDIVVTVVTVVDRYRGAAFIDSCTEVNTSPNNTNSLLHGENQVHHP